MSKPKLTPWYPARTHPVREGWYQVKGIFYDGLIVWRYWTGVHWQWRDTAGQMTRASVSASCDSRGIVTEDQWRGLASPPKDAP